MNRKAQQNTLVEGRFLSRKLKNLVSMFSVLSVIAVLYSNCSAQHPAIATVTSSAGVPTQSFSSCSLTGPDNLFQLTYYQFAQTNCAGCHTSTGAEAAYPFADANLQLAYTAFYRIGYTTFDSFATNGHSPAAVAANVVPISTLSQEWTQGINELSVCTNAPVPTFVNDPYQATRTWSVSKAVAPNVTFTSPGVVKTPTTPSVIQWDLNTEMLPSPAGVTWPSMPGAVFQLTVYPVPNGANTYYMLTQPSIVYPNGNASAIDLNVNSIILKLNGVIVNNETTFTFVNAQARNNTTTLLAAGGMASIGTIRASDVVSFSIGAISHITLPPIPSPPDVTFAATTSTVNQSALVNNITVSLNQVIDQNVIVHFTYDTTKTTAKPNCCATIADKSPMNLGNVQVLNFDREFTLTGCSGTTTLDCTVVFPPRIQSETISVNLINDARVKPSKNVVLNLTAMQVGSNAQTSIVPASSHTHTMTITNSNVAPSTTNTTFSQLMQPGGAFALNCVGCHWESPITPNTVVPYDMTTYEELIMNNRVVPGNLTLSILWQRIIESNPALNPMPAGGVFNPADPNGKNEIQSWILGGALNN